MSKTRTETLEHFLAHITHLHLQAKRIRVIENLECCANLKVLYLYDNRIENIENLNFAKGLSYLYLENNCISKMPNFTNTKLKKLFLDENEIRVVEGLNNCRELSTLSVARQRLPKLTPLSFQRSSLDAISETLEVLDISGNNISELGPFHVLFRLKKLFCSDNNISDVGEIEGIVSLRELSEINFKRNPCCTLRRYKDYVIGAASDALRMFDDVPITQKNIDAIRGIQKLRRKIGLVDGSQSMSVDKYEDVQQFEPSQSHDESSYAHSSKFDQPEEDGQDADDGDEGDGEQKEYVDDQSLTSSNGGQVVESEFTMSQY
eukprot:CAMPEP_0185032430 /NCGR_PEP_ID=MMETSP1103-20130426/20506_1 /TAXON_ID=36769 /ORGANISM="Paraphysomonas bandaiensis, Strain Caron Lab Isolate" /LENGTH=318 /DNA_ID=CAMNT_0027568329 /DNA_START=96 /DNA_END=1052 /DNA_ORIENTATION=-